MLKGILNKLGLVQETLEKDPELDPEADQEFDLTNPDGSIGYHPDQIRSMVDAFPIGGKLRYYPEFKKDVVLDTVITGYLVNQQFIYSADALERDEQGQLTGFHFVNKATSTDVLHVRQFKLLVPDTSHLETTLDYDRLAEIGRNRQFVTGNSITLIATQGRKFITLDTVVSRRLILKEGPYANSKMIFLMPNLNTLTVGDQRKKIRTEGNAPATLTLPNSSTPIACRLVDISEDEVVQIRMADSETTLPKMLSGDAVVLDVDLGGPGRKYLVEGSVLRYSPTSCVIKMNSILKNGKHLHLTPLDFIEMKSGILNYVAVDKSSANQSAKVILIVEDDDDLRQLMRTTLEDGFREIHEAQSAAEVLAMITAIHPDILLVDIGLEGPVDGLSLCETLLQNIAYRHLQVLVVTGSEAPSNIEKARRLGLDVYLNKPFSPVKLASLVAQAESRCCDMSVIPSTVN